MPVLANVKTTGRHPVEYFWYAGGVPAVMLELREMLHLDCLTVTGKTEINIPERRLAIVGTGGKRQPPETIDATPAQRRRIWKPPRRRHDTGILSLYERVARSAAEGAWLT